MKQQKTTVPIIVAVVCLVAILRGCSDKRPEPASVPAPPASLTGSFEVYYDLQISETRGLNTGPQKVKAMHFYDKYIIIENEGRGGRVIPLSQIKHFRWD